MRPYKCSKDGCKKAVWAEFAKDVDLCEECQENEIKKDPDSYGAMLDRGFKELREKMSNPEIPDNSKGKE